MAQISSTLVNSNLRTRVFDNLFEGGSTELDGQFTKINDRQYGLIMTDLNGVERYVRIGVIVAEEREDVSARELMENEVAKYQAAVAKKEAAAVAKAEKIARDQKRREEALAKKQAKEAEKG